MEFCLLGPLVVRNGGAAVRVPPGKQRALLAALLLKAGRLVTLEELAEVLWGQVPPPSARVSVQNYVMRLRKVLTVTGRTFIATQPGGYLISVDAAELDVTQFEALLGTARAATRDGSWATAAGHARAALALWRGEPLAGVGSEMLTLREVPRLSELQLQAQEARIGADLHLGGHSEVIAELQRLCRAHPLREQLHALLMLALYRDSRRAEALAAYQDARRVLVEELGMEPGPELRGLQQQILASDPALIPAPAASRTCSVTGDDDERAGHAHAGVQAAVPHQLPAPVAHFAGRETEMAALSGLAAGQAGTVVISAVGGMAGVGKTALAVHWAHQVADRFRDGQLYVNLGGFGPSGNPVTPGAAVRGFLDALGVAPQRIPPDPSAQSAMYRSLLCGRQMLIVLDNALDEAQVRPLLPASPGCVVMVTSRTQLTGLVAAEGARLINLDVLSDAEAREMLARRLGSERVAAEPAAGARLIRLCARLPLALAVTAARAAARPGFPLAALAAELRDEPTRLEVLDGGDPATSVQAVFSWSYQNLTGPAACTFRLLGLHPATGITAHTAASLAALPLDQAREILRELARRHLLAEPAPGRYTFHDLVRAYAVRQCQALDGESGRRAALTRLFDYFLAAAGQAMDTLVPAERHRRPQIPPPGTPLPALGTPEAASAWLGAERAALMAVAGHSATQGWPRHAIALSAILFRYYRDIGAYHSDALTVHSHALRAAELSGDRAAHADALMNLGMVALRQDAGQRAASQLGQALDIYRELGDRRSQARAHSNLGVLLWDRGRYESSGGHFQQALDLHREFGDCFGQAIALDNLGTVRGRQGRYSEAAGYHRRALVIRRELGHRQGEARALGNLGIVLCWQGRPREAADHLELALGMFREFGDRIGEADTLNDLATALRSQGRCHEAVALHQQALDMFRELGIRSGEAEALNGAGEALNALGRTRQARAQHRDALTVAGQLGHQHLEARSHDGLASTYHASGRLDQARYHWENALARYASLGVPEAAQVRARLASLSARAVQKGGRSHHARTDPSRE
jgi:DNA-binding SARP family transcriptional activator